MNLDDIVLSCSGLIHKVAGSFYGVEKEDLYQAGMLGLIKAYQNYHGEEGAKFTTYAYNYIYGEMYMLAYNKGIKASRDILRIYHDIEKARYSLAQKYGRIPSNSEIAAFLEMDESTINEAIMAGLDVMSLDSGEETNLYDTIEAEEAVSMDEQIYLEQGISALSDEERMIIEARYFEDLTQREVAERMQMSQVKVSRYEKRSLSKMNEYLSK